MIVIHMTNFCEQEGRFMGYGEAGQVFEIRLL